MSYLQSQEGSQCHQSSQAPGCWVQVGWVNGYMETAGGCQNNYDVKIQTNEAVHVFVEIYDDSTSPCLLGDYGVAPSIASYDARYYTYTGGQGPYQYAVYYEAPGTNNIQILAYADFNAQTTAETATSEVLTTQQQGYGYPYCSILGNTPSGEWNVFGQSGTPSQNLFAGPLNLRIGGGWQNWTNGTGVPSQGYLAPPPLGTSKGNQYQIQAISNFNGGDFTEWESGGPHT